MSFFLRYRHAIAVIALLLWALGASLFLAKHDSVTTDEAPHLASAYTSLIRHDYRFEPEHPFLFKTLCALPILALHPNLPKDDQKYWNDAAPSFYDSWMDLRSWADEWLYQSGNNASEMIFLARLPAVLCFVLLCGSVYLVGRRWFSPAAGLWALFFTAFNPTLLAHGHLVTTDVPAALTFVWSAYALWAYGERPSYLTASWLGLALATALLTKFSAVVLLPIIPLYLVYRFWKARPAGRKIVAQVLLSLLIVWASIWSMYGWHSQYVPGTPLVPATVRRVEGHGISIGTLGKVSSRILPMSYVTGLTLISDDTEDGRGSYLLGKIELGAWYYFPVLYLLKTPLAVIVLNLGGAFLLVRRRDAASRLIALILLVYGVAALVSKLHLGIRHLIPPIAFSGLLSALCIGALLGTEKRRAWIGVLAVVLCAGPVLIQFPNLLNFSNVIVQPKQDAYRYFSDSNLDWGQDMSQVASLVHSRYPGQPVYFDPVWGNEEPRYYGLEYSYFNPEYPPTSGVAVVAASSLAADPTFASFRNRMPVAHVSNTTYIYLLQ